MVRDDLEPLANEAFDPDHSSNGVTAPAGTSSWRRSTPTT
jgi:hypothetical protein